jgi:hypothetical protein
MFFPARGRNPWFANVFSIGHGDRLLLATNTDGIQLWPLIQWKSGRIGTSNDDGLSRRMFCDREFGIRDPSTVLVHATMADSLNTDRGFRAMI